MGKHTVALTAAIFSLGANALVPEHDQSVHPFSDQKITRFAEYLESMFNMF